MHHQICVLILIFTTFSEVLCFGSSDALEPHVYRMSLIRRKSPLQMMLTDPKHAKTLNMLRTRSPTNENITLFKYLDSEYYAEILVGKPGQRFTVIFDTTLADMWLPSKLCSKTLSPACKTKHLYDGNASSTHIPIDPKPFEIGGYVGNLTCDTVRLYHLNVTNLIFAEIRKFPNTFDYPVMHADGIIGLAYNNQARTTNNTFFYKLLADRKIVKPIFSVYMNRDPTTPKGGIIFLGGVEPKHMKGEMTYVPVTKKRYWQIEMKQFSVQMNKTKAKTFCETPCQVILDTSSNKIGLPKEYVVAVNDLIGAEEYLYNRFVLIWGDRIKITESTKNYPVSYLLKYVTFIMPSEVPCTKVNKLPTITFSFGDKIFQIGGRHYILKMENGTDAMICMSAFCDAQLEEGLWSLGGAFLSSVYTKFDLENNQVGFAELK